MNTNSLPSVHTDPSAWQHAMYAFLAEKERRSGSRRTVEGYSRMLRDCFARLGTTPDHVKAPEVLGWAHGIGLSGRRPSSITIGARIACLSSFYRFLIRMGMVSSNPCDALERPKLVTAPARGLGPDDVRRLLAAIPVPAGRQVAPVAAEHVARSVATRVEAGGQARAAGRRRPGPSLTQNSPYK